MMKIQCEIWVGVAGAGRHVTVELPRHERSKRKIQGGSVLDPAERAVLRIAGRNPKYSYPQSHCSHARPCIRLLTTRPAVCCLIQLNYTCE